MNTIVVLVTTFFAVKDCSCSDEPLEVRRGKVNRECLSQDTLMWQLTEQLVVRHASWILFKNSFIGGLLKTPRKPVSVCTWQGVFCDKEMNVVSIDWRAELLRFSLKGNISFPDLPRHLDKLVVTDHVALTGEIPTRSLPSSLRHINTYHNIFFGSLQLSTLPEGLEILNGNHNRFSGHLDLCHLPHTIRRILLNHNRFSGTITVDALPPRIELLWLHANLFAGTVDLSPLQSDQLKDINLRLGQNPLKILEGSISSDALEKILRGSQVF